MIWLAQYDPSLFNPIYFSSKPSGNPELTWAHLCIGTFDLLFDEIRSCCFLVSASPAWVLFLSNELQEHCTGI